jgi:hypothetical protein
VKSAAPIKTTPAALLYEIGLPLTMFGIGTVKVGKAVAPNPLNSMLIVMAMRPPRIYAIITSVT